jgi:hypothetical protein
MKRNRALQILIWGFVLLSLACVILPKSVDNGVVTPAAASPTLILPTDTVPAPTATISPIKTPTTAVETQSSIPTATVFPEEQLYTVTDQTKVIEVTVPTVWTDMRTLPWTDAKGATIGTIFMVSTDVEAFLKFQAEGVAISVSGHLPVGYTQLLDDEYKFYIQQCQDTYKTRWRLDDNPIYRGMYFVFGECKGQRDTWLSLFSLVSKQGTSRYIARVVAYDMIPTYGDTFRDIILKFKVFPENLP